jgi:hypothetical protein
MEEAAQQSPKMTQAAIFLTDSRTKRAVMDRERERERERENISHG